MKTPYKLSRDYEKAYKLLCEGNDLAGYVDYSYSDEPDSVPNRDIVKIRRFAGWAISIGARGIQYMSVDFWHGDDMQYAGKKVTSELEAFILCCQSCNLEFIEVHN